VQKYDRSSLQVLGTVGEPMNPEAWRWYYETIGGTVDNDGTKNYRTIVDTYWQTETGGHVITNFPGVTPMKPGSCTLPSYGIDPVVLDPLTGAEVTEPNEEGRIEGVLAFRQSWPGMARTCLNDHQRYLQTYLQPYPGYYFTGDSVVKDKDGYYFIIGRVDDVLNVSGHRIGTAEVESALVAHYAVTQAAVVGQPHDIKGQAIAAFVMLKDHVDIDLNNKEQVGVLQKELLVRVRTDIGAFSTPDMLVIVPGLPMTRSGKIMRRILRKIVSNEIDSLGDISTLADPSVVDSIISEVQQLQSNR
jgi:acetyl-CoA synthetase